MIDITCYQNVIGLSNTECDCWDTDKPSDFNTSESGLFITDLDPLTHLKPLENCENGTLWDVLEKSRDNAILAFIADTNALLLESYSLQRKPFYGGIGEKKATDYRTISEMYAGVRLNCERINSGVLVIKNIGTNFKLSGTIILQIYNSFNEKIGGDITLNTVAGVPTDNIQSTPIELPLFNKNECLEYFFVYLLGSNQPKATRVNCNCGNFKPLFKVDSPYYKRDHVGKNAWANYLMIGGLETDDITAFDEEMSVYSTSYMNGLFFDVELKCKVREVLCQDSLDFEGNPLAIAMAMAIRYKSASLLADSILKSGDPNLQTLVNADALSVAREEWIEQYNVMTEYIASNVNLQANDCLCEKNVFGLTSKGVFS